MSIVEGRGPAVDPRLIQRGGYALAVVGSAVGLAALFVQAALVAAAAIALALATLGVTLWTPELFEVGARGKSRVLNPIFIAPAGLTFYAALADHFVALSPLLITAGIGAGLAVAAAVPRSRRPSLAGPSQYVAVLALIGAALGYGATAQIDVQFDGSPPHPYRATVNTMDVPIGRTGTGSGYYLSLGPWGPMGASRVRVSSSLYDRLNPREPVCIALRNGALAIPWFSVDACPGPS